MALSLNSPLAKAGAVVFVIAALGYAGYAIFKNVGASVTAETDIVTVVCAACGADTDMSSAKYRELKYDPNAGLYACPKCNAMQAQTTSLRCPSCNRAFLRPPVNAAMVCPHCKAPF
ncbi:MAG: hypothetical protein AB1716_21865 [Planctomycetota bacterium]